MLTCQRVYHVFLKTGIQYFEPHKNKESVQLVSLCARTLPIRFYHHQAVCTYGIFCKIYSRYILSSIWNLMYHIRMFFSHILPKKSSSTYTPPRCCMGCTSRRVSVKCAAWRVKSQRHQTDRMVRKSTIFGVNLGIFGVILMIFIDFWMGDHVFFLILCVVFCDFLMIFGNGWLIRILFWWRYLGKDWWL